MLGEDKVGFGVTTDFSFQTLQEINLSGSEMIGAICCEASDLLWRFFRAMIFQSQGKLTSCLCFPTMRQKMLYLGRQPLAEERLVPKTFA